MGNSLRPDMEFGPAIEEKHRNDARKIQSEAIPGKQRYKYHTQKGKKDLVGIILLSQIRYGLEITMRGNNREITLMQRNLSRMARLCLKEEKGLESLEIRAKRS